MLEEEINNDYPLIDNHKWYAENGTVYNSVDETVRIVLLHDNGSYTNLPNEIAVMIANALNSRINNFISVKERLPQVNKTVEVMMDNGKKTIGYYYDNEYRSGWMTKTNNGLFANQIWSGIKVVSWKE